MPDLRALAEAATPGPWRSWIGAIAGTAFIEGVTDRVLADISLSPADAAYIAAANPEVMLALLDVVDAARDYVREYERPAGRGRYISHEVDEAHLTGEPCRLCDALARYEEVSRDPA